MIFRSAYAEMLTSVHYFLSFCARVIFDRLRLNFLSMQTAISQVIQTSLFSVSAMADGHTVCQYILCHTFCTSPSVPAWPFCHGASCFLSGQASCIH